MEISALTFSMEEYDIFYGIPWKSSMQFHRNSVLHRLFHGSPWSFMEFTGIRHLKYPVNQMEYITDFGPMQFI